MTYARLFNLNFWTKFMKKIHLKLSIISMLLIVSITSYSAIQIDTFSSASNVSNLATADGLIDGSITNNGTATAMSNFVDHVDSGSRGRFANNLPIPGGFVNDFAFHATCTVDIPTTGDFTFGTNNDDGARLRIDGMDIIVDDSRHGTRDFFGTTTLTAGMHSLDLVFFERGGGASIELFAAAGTFATFDASMRLVGDTANGGLSCNVPTDLTITKTDGVTSAVPGNSLTYTIVASNAGPNDDPSVSVTDTFPAGLTCAYTSISAGGATGNTSGAGNLAETLNMPNGSSVTYTANCSIASSATGTLSNTATISGSLPDSSPANNSATDNDTVLTPMADLSIAMTGPSNITTPSTITYNIDVTNAGPSDAVNTVVTDMLNANVFAMNSVGCLEDPNGYPTCTLGTLASGATASYTIALDVGSVNGAVINDVSATSNAIDPTPANNTASSSTQGTPNVIPTLNQIGLMLIILLLLTLGIYSIPKKQQ